MSVQNQNEFGTFPRKNQLGSNVLSVVVRSTRSPSGETTSHSTSRNMSPTSKQRASACQGLEHCSMLDLYNELSASSFHHKWWRGSSAVLIQSEQIWSDAQCDPVPTVLFQSSLFNGLNFTVRWIKKKSSGCDRPRGVYPFRTGWPIGLEPSTTLVLPTSFSSRTHGGDWMKLLKLVVEKSGNRPS